MTDLASRTDRPGWALLTLNRPDRLNTLTGEMFEELRIGLAEYVVPYERLDAGLQREVAESRGAGPDMHERIAALAGRSREGVAR